MLIVIEGLDGAGKSTQVRKVRSYLSTFGTNLRYLHFPRFNAPVVGEMLAKFLRGDFGANESVHPMLVALLFAEDRRDAAVITSRWLHQGDIVLFDRYVYSNIAYQCAKVENEQESEQLRQWIFNTEYVEYRIPKPDLNIFLDVPISFVDSKLKESRKGDDREYLNGKADIHEADIDFQKKVRAVYLKQCTLDEKFIRINCAAEDGSMLPANDIFEKIKIQIDHLMENDN